LDVSALKERHELLVSAATHFETAQHEGRPTFLLLSGESLEVSWVGYSALLNYQMAIPLSLETFLALGRSTFSRVLEVGVNSTVAMPLRSL
jgi:hypothetical protein